MTLSLPRFAVLFASAVSVAPAAESGAPVLRPFALMGNPPPIQMLAPGFVVRELPVQLTNINNLAYGPEGRLYAYAFDGKIHRLQDTDGDGLEDQSEIFYANERGVIGTVGMRWGKDALYLASRMQVMRFPAAHRQPADGRPAFEVVASDWHPPDTIAPTSRYMDAYGLAVDAQGHVFFGLGISDIRNAYRIDPSSRKSHYTRTWDRGTIQQVRPSGRRDIYATGLRFTVSLALNAAGDLFATDQEGATWLYNGNRFDELLHIQPARHYGFPPRHPVHLPYVIDEPSVYDYAPQHQATCSVNFNEPFAWHRVPGLEPGPDANWKHGVFGPAWWQGDAIVTGSARGRIYRTQLYKTAAGYIARNETIAHLSMLTVDAVPTPDGGLVISCHSGRPDWGTGPTGMGKLYKIEYRDREASQPVFAYAASPTEMQVVFDRPISAQQFPELTVHTQITMGEYVSGGDRFESLRPGYQAVKDQQKVARFQLPVLEANVDRTRNALVLRTAPRVDAVQFSVALREGAQPRRAYDQQRRELWQHAAIDLQFDLSGVEAAWRDAAGEERWRGWLPHLDLAVARAFTAPSTGHAELFRQLAGRGTLELRGQLNLHSMLRPLVQPGATMDYEWPPEVVQIRFRANRPLELETGGAARVNRINEREWQLVLARTTEAWAPLTVRMQTGEAEPQLDVSWTTDEDARPRALALHRVLLPWAKKPTRDQSVGARREIPELAGGDWQRGHELFHGKSTCGICHAFEGKGGTLGPDLSNLVHRDYQSVMQDIIDPNATLNPDYIAISLQKKNGETLAGVLLRNENDHHVLGLPNGQTLLVPRDEVVPGSNQPLGMSLMPPGLLDALSEQERKDLLTFLLVPRHDSRP